jgi:hypothetical protein
MKREFKAQQENRTGYQVTNWVRSVQEGARYTKIHIKHNILIHIKLKYPATPFPQRCRIKQFLLHFQNVLTFGQSIG